jgi:hypothetical protein
LLQPFFSAFLRKLTLVLPEAIGNPPSTWLNVFAEFQHIIMAASALKRSAPGRFHPCGFGQLVFVVFQHFAIDLLLV